MKKLIALLLTLFSFNAFATHIVGGEMNYTYLGNNQYVVTLTVYRDCSLGITTDFDDPAYIGIFDGNGNLFQTLTLPFTGRTPINPVFNVPCGTPPNNVCVEYAVYTDTITLPPGDYTLQYQRCCRNNSILNIEDPDATGATYTAQIPNVNTVGPNSNPVITNPPPVYACAGLPLSQNFSAVDADGDSLVYTLCVPYTGADDIVPQPTPPSFTPISNVIWSPGVSLNNVLNSTVPLTINAQTGVISGIPENIGQYVFTVCVEEYRNGQLISTTRRDMQYNIVDCQINVISAFTTPQGTCGNTVNFANNSSGATQYSWDFGDITSSTDVSTDENPSYTYPGPGTYTVTLIAIDSAGSSCIDTLNINITVNPPFVIDAGPDVSFCTGLGATIGPNGSFPGVTWQWSPIFALSSTTVQNPLASPAQTTSYVLTATNSDGCVDTDTVSVLVGQFPLTVVDTALSADCNGWTLTLSAPTLQGYNISWLFTDSVFIAGSPITRNFMFGDTVSVFAYFVDPSGGCSDTVFFPNLLPPTAAFFSLPIPNVFTPNGDGVNECFKPNILPGFETCYTMVIYNRWGRKVFETDETNTCWNGQIKADGAEASEGVYFYIITLEGGKTYNGTVMLAKGK